MKSRLEESFFSFWVLAPFVFPGNNQRWTTAVLFVQAEFLSENHSEWGVVPIFLKNVRNVFMYIYFLPRWTYCSAIYLITITMGFSVVWFHPDNILRSIESSDLLLAGPLGGDVLINLFNLPSVVLSLMFSVIFWEQLWMLPTRRSSPQLCHVILLSFIVVSIFVVAFPSPILLPTSISRHLFQFLLQILCNDL